MPKRKFEGSYGGGGKRMKYNPGPRVVSSAGLRAAILRQAETKQIVISSSTAGALTCLDEFGFRQLSANAQSTTDLTHIGDEMTPVKFNMNLRLLAGDATNLVRIIVFQWLDDATAATPDAALWNWNSDANTTEAPLGMLDYSRRSSVNVLYDSGPISMVAGTSADSYQWVKRLSIPGSRLRTMKLNRGSGSGGKGQFYIGYCSDSAAVAHPSIEYTSQILFKDV